MKMNRQALSKMMSEVSKELGMAASKKSGAVAKKMLWAAGSVAGYYLIRGIDNKTIK